ncbi:WD40 repeat domain-containing protein [Nocardia sp. NPDC051832]|uniref:WD40 repeat domain-containing protein n=1 Tax=Nocardia sp. NPDC051832 TaxID=3155673 RepID=UPI00342A16C1
MTSNGSRPDRDWMAELTGAPQRWMAMCRTAVRDGAEASQQLLGDTDHLRALGRESLATWIRGSREDALLEEDEQVGAADGRIGADLSAARAVGALAQAITGAMAAEPACAALLAHAGRAGLHSPGTQLMPAHEVPGNRHLREIILHLLRCGSEPARGFGVLLALELADQRPPTRRVSRIPVLFATFDRGGLQGEVGTLVLQQLDRGPSGLHPDPAWMAFLQADEEFTDSLAAAWETSRLAATDACVVWSIRVDRGAPANRISGGSVAAALAVALDDLAPRYRRFRHLRPRRLDPRCAVTAGLAGHDLTRVAGYPDKLQAAQQHSLHVVVATEGYDAAAGHAPPGWSQQIRAAGTVSEAIRQSRTKFNSRLWAVALAVLLVLGGIGATAAEFAQLRTTMAREQAQARSQLAAGVADSLRAFDPAVAQQIGLGAWRAYDTVEARSAVLNSSAVLTPLRVLPEDGDTARVSPMYQGSRMAASADGALLATMGTEGNVQLIRSTAGHAQRFPRFDSRNGQVRGIALGRQGRWLATAGESGATLWDVADPSAAIRVADLPLGQYKPWSIALSPDDRHLAIATQTGTVLIWDIGTPALPIPLPSITLPGTAQVIVTASDRYLATVSTGREAEVGVTTTVTLWTWDVRPAVTQTLDRVVGHAAAFSDDGTTLAVAAEFDGIRRWRLGPEPSDMAALPSIPTAGAAFDVTFSGDGRYFAAVGLDQQARVWAADTGQQLVAAPSPLGVQVRLSGDGRSLVTNGLDHTVRVFDLSRTLMRTPLQTITRLPGDGAPTASADLLARIQRLPITWRLGQVDPQSLSVIAVSPDGARAATIDSGGVQVWNIEDPLAPTRFGPPVMGFLGLRWGAIAFSPDGRLAIGDTLGTSVKLFDVTSEDRPKLSSSVSVAGSPISAIGFNKDGTLLAVGAVAAGTVSVFDIKGSGAPRVVLDLPDVKVSKVGKLTLAIDAHRTLAVGTGPAIYLYDLNGGAGQEPTMTGSGASLSGVTSLAFNHEGTRLAVALPNIGAIQVWDTTDPRQPRVFANLANGRPRGKITFVEFADRGQTLIQTTMDGAVEQWDVDPAAQQRRICASGTALIDAAEWSAKLPGTLYLDPCGG